MKYAILVNSDQNSSNAAYTAYHFIKATLTMGHEVMRVFFYHHGVYQSYRYSLPPDDELQMTKKWTQLANEHQLDLVVCISSAQRRGLLSSDEAKRQGKLDDDLADGFRISGLGQLLEATIVADRFIEFG